MGSRNEPSRRLYVGRLPPDANRLEVEDFFSSTGIKPVEVKLLSGYGFIEFDSVADAEDAMRDFDGKDFMGDRLLVQFAKSGGERTRRYDDREPPRGGDRGYDRGGPREKPAQGWRLTISNLPQGCSWQDLKDFARTAGSVHYAEVSRQDTSEGIIEYMSHSDAEAAIKTLDGVDMRGSVVRLTEHTAPAGQTWSAPRASPPRRDRRDDDRPARRDRSRSPANRRDRNGDRDRDRGDDRSYRRSDRDDRRDRDDGERRAPRRDRSRSPAPRDRSPRYD